MRVAFFDYSLLFYSQGLANLMGVLKTYGHEYKLFIISEEKDIIKSLKEFKPDLLGFTTVTGGQYPSFNLARYIKKHMDVLTVFGGPHVTMFPEESIREDCVDIICRGEGEIPLIELINAIENNEDYSKIENLWVKKDGEIVRNEIRDLMQDLDKLPMPDRSQYLKYPIVRDLPLKRFLAGYGCPHQCSFCHNAIFLKEIFKGKGCYLRKKSVDRVLKEIKEVQEISCMKRVHFHDDNFNYHKEWLEEFCNRYSKEIGIPWSCSIRVDTITEPIVKMMHGAGCVGVISGIETHNERIRNDVLDKRLTNEDFERASRLFKKYNIKHLTAVMLNLPGDSFEDVFKMLEYVRKLKVFGVRPGIYVVSKKQPIIKMLLEKKYIDKVPEIDNFKQDKLEDVALQTPDLKRIIRISPFINLMLKFPFLELLIRFITLFPFGRLGNSGRLFDGYLEMRFMGVPLIQGLRYYFRVKAGFRGTYRLR